MQGLRNFIFFIFITASTPVYAASDPITTLTNELTHHIVTVLKEMRNKGVTVDFFCESCSQKMQARHIYQRAFDIDRQLTTFMEMHGQDVEDITAFQLKRYNKSDLEDVLQLIDQKLELVLFANEIEVKHDLDYSSHTRTRDHYSVLDRIEKFLLSIGAPSVQPKSVLIRAKVINRIIRSLCVGEVCPSTQRSPLNLVTPKMPIHVYRELNRIITLLKKYTRLNGIKIVGGVSVPALSKEIITPRIVNRTSGILLADLLEIRHVIGDAGELPVPGTRYNVTPTHVWNELNFARRYLEDLVY